MVNLVPIPNGELGRNGELECLLGRYGGKQTSQYWVTGPSRAPSGSGARQNR
jgi:hypothetical protein